MRMIKKITLALILFAFSFGIYACQEKSKNYSLNLSADKESICIIYSPIQADR